LSPSALTLEIAWYPQDVGRRLATQRQTLAVGGNVVLDPSQVEGVSGNAGLTVVTPIAEGTEGRPIVPEPLNDTLASAASGPLAGGFTLADLSTGSAFGQNPLARIAVTADGRRAAPGSIVDGTTVRYQRIAPDVLAIPFYFNPTTAGFSNRALLGAFEDRYAADIFNIGPASVDLGYGLIDAAGADVATGSLTVTGVRFTDVQTLADATPLTSSGKVVFGATSPLPENANLLGLMSQSLGTFAVGQGLPGYFGRNTQGKLVLDNGDFDGGNVGWGEESQQFPGSLIVEGGVGGVPAADSGTRVAWLGRTNDETSDLSQVIAVPAGIGPSFVKFRYQIASEETDCNQVTPPDVVSLLVNGVQVDSLLLCAGFNTGPPWGDFSFVPDLAAYAGQTIALRSAGGAHRLRARGEGRERPAARRIAQGRVVLVHARGREDASQRGAERHRLVALGEALQDGGADGAAVARAHGGEEVVLDVVAEVERQPLEQPRQRDRERVRQGIVHVRRERAQVVVRHDERHDDRVRDQQGDDVDDDERQRPDDAGDADPDGDAQQRLHDRTTVQRRRQDPLATRHPEHLLALTGESEHQAQHAEPAAASKPELVGHDARAAVGLVLAQRRVHVGVLAGTTAVLVVEVVVPRVPQGRRQGEGQQAQPADEANRPPTMHDASVQDLVTEEHDARKAAADEECRERPQQRRQQARRDGRGQCGDDREMYRQPDDAAACGGEDLRVEKRP